ncbi:MAG TPA: T9SS type A sorting domain-containing protein [Flavobacterium sp.]|jgi:hypothetical protein|nr:T9SS type A sorting domain-containing protein [Flavobacterium sp.]
MKKLYTLSLLLVGLLSFGQAQDSFNGTGALNANGWMTHSGATPGQLSIAPGSLTYPGMTTSGNRAVLVAGNTEDVNLASAAPITGTAYYSAIVNVPNTTGLNINSTVGDYFLTMGATAGAGVTAFSGRLYVRLGSVENTFNLGILNNSGGTATPSFVATDFPVGTPVFVVVKNDLASNTSSLFINPTIGGTEGASSANNNTGTTAAPTQISSLAIRQGGNATTGTGNVELDEVRLGSTWEFVTSAALSVTKNSIAGLSIYPNPAVNGTLFIDTAANSTKSVVIYDIVGKQVLKTNTTNMVNVSNLTGGVYVVKITEDGKTATRKLVIK